MISICALQCRLFRPVFRPVVVLAIAWFALGGSVRADIGRDTLADIAKCSGIDDSVERLRCFDRAAPRAREALTPRAEDFGKPPVAVAPEMEQVSANVVEFSRTARGRAIFVLDNGQKWRQIDGDDAQVAEPLPGEPQLRVTIAKGLFGSYNLTIEGRNGSVKVRRVD